MRRLVRSLAGLAVLAAAITPMPAGAGLLTSSCSSTFTAQNGSCALAVAGPNLYIQLELEGATTTPTPAVVAASLSFGNDVASVVGMSCVAQGQVSLTRKLVCFAAFGPGEAGVNVADLPAGAPLRCDGFKTGSSKPGRLTCSSTSI